MVLLAGLVELFEESVVCCPVGQGLGGERLVGALDGFAFGFGVGAGVDLGCGHVGVAEQVAYDLPRVFQTARLTLIHALSCRLRYLSWTSCGVRYPSAEWRRV